MFYLSCVDRGARMFGGWGSAHVRRSQSIDKLNRQMSRIPSINKTPKAQSLEGEEKNQRERHTMGYLLLLDWHKVCLITLNGITIVPFSLRKRAWLDLAPRPSSFFLPKGKKTTNDVLRVQKQPKGKRTKSTEKMRNIFITITRLSTRGSAHIILRSTGEKRERKYIFRSTIYRDVRVCKGKKRRREYR